MPPRAIEAQPQPPGGDVTDTEDGSGELVLCVQPVLSCEAEQAGEELIQFMPMVLAADGRRLMAEIPAWGRQGPSPQECIRAAASIDVPGSRSGNPSSSRRRFLRCRRVAAA